MNELIKIRDITTKYGISARALRYYEDMGLITSTVDLIQCGDGSAHKSQIK